MPFHIPGNLPDPGIELASTMSSALQAIFTAEPPGHPLCVYISNRLYMCAQLLQSCLTLCHLWTVAHQAPRSMGFSRLQQWSELSCLPPEKLPDLGIEFVSPALQADSLPTESLGKTNRVYIHGKICREYIGEKLNYDAQISGHQEYSIF